MKYPIAATLLALSLLAASPLQADPAYPKALAGVLDIFGDAESVPRDWVQSLAEVYQRPVPEVLGDLHHRSGPAVAPPPLEPVLRRLTRHLEGGELPTSGPSRDQAAPLFIPAAPPARTSAATSSLVSLDTLRQKRDELRAMSRPTPPELLRPTPRVEPAPAPRVEVIGPPALAPAPRPVTLSRASAGSGPGRILARYQALARAAGILE